MVFGMGQCGHSWGLEDALRARLELVLGQRSEAGLESHQNMGWSW